MDSIKRLTTEALQEIEDGRGFEALLIIVAAIEEIAEELEYRVLFDGTTHANAEYEASLQ